MCIVISADPLGSASVWGELVPQDVSGKLRVLAVCVASRAPLFAQLVVKSRSCRPTSSEKAILSPN